MSAVAFFKRRDYDAHRAKIAKCQFCVGFREHDKKLSKVEPIVFEILASGSKRSPRMEIGPESELDLEVPCRVETRLLNPIEPNVERSTQDR
jgi:hypothetical protein